MSEKKNEKLWGGRFQDAADPLMEAFTQSVSYDQLLAHFDIQGSKAHAAMLKAQKLLTEDEWQAIDKGLDEIAEEKKRKSQEENESRRAAEEEEKRRTEEELRRELEERQRMFDAPNGETMLDGEENKDEEESEKSSDSEENK